MLSNSATVDSRAADFAHTAVTSSTVSGVALIRFVPAPLTQLEEPPPEEPELLEKPPPDEPPPPKEPELRPPERLDRPAELVPFDEMELCDELEKPELGEEPVVLRGAGAPPDGFDLSDVERLPGGVLGRWLMVLDGVEVTGGLDVVLGGGLPVPFGGLAGGLGAPPGICPP